MKSERAKRRESMAKLRIQLRVVFYKESEMWIAHCLEMDIVGHGAQKHKALEMMCEAISDQLEFSLAHNNQANIFQPADARFFEMYAAGKDVADGTCTVQEIGELKKADNVEIAPLQTREFQRSLLDSLNGAQWRTVY